MNTEFWLNRWNKNEIGFHLPEANPALTRNFSKLGLAHGSNVLIPLCGKTLDIAWLLSQGYQVVGVELSEIAVAQLFAELGVIPQLQEQENLTAYSAPGLKVFRGDFFDLTPSKLGAIDAIYDRAAIIALPFEIRSRYVPHLLTLAPKAPQLLITFEYDQSLKNGPPFSVEKAEVKRHYEHTYDLELQDAYEVPPRPGRDFSALECIWVLKPKA